MFNEEEKRLSLKNIETLRKRRSYLEYMVKYIDLMLSEGIYFNYLNALDQKRMEKKAIVEEMVQIDMNIGATQYQIDNGVEQLDKKETTQEQSITDDNVISIEDLQE